jgi:hypothetical protein
MLICAVAISERKFASDIELPWLSICSPALQPAAAVDRDVKDA